MTLSDATAGAAIYYSTDGSTPTANSTLYTAPISIPTAPLTETISALAVLNGVPSYSVISTTYVIIPSAATPVLSIASGTYSAPFTVAISDSTPGAAIYYTLDNSTPTTSSPQYGGPLSISTPTKLKAIAVASGYTASKVVGNNYGFVVPGPAILPTTGTYGTNQTVTVSDSFRGSTIHYTTDGTTPTLSSAVYTGPFSTPTTGTEVVQAIATASGYTNSAVSQSTLTLQLPLGVIANTVLGSAPSGLIPSSFLGYSHDWGVAQNLMGNSALGVNQIYRTLSSTLSTKMQGPLSIRVGGGSTETSGSASSATVEPFVELAQNSNVDFILGVNLGSNNLSLAEEQAYTFTSSLPSGALAGLEIGNEPDAYSSDGYRPSTYTYSDFLTQFQEWSQGIVDASSPSPAPIAGPALGGGGWVPNAQADLLTGALQVATVTQHYYVACYNPASPLASNILLQPSSSTAISYLQSYVAAAHQVGSQFRIAEMNSICNGGQPGVSNSFSSALWAIDTMFEAASIGVDGVNWNTNYDSGPYDLFHFAIWNPSSEHIPLETGATAILWAPVLFRGRRQSCAATASLHFDRFEHKSLGNGRRFRKHSLSHH